MNLFFFTDELFVAFEVIVVTVHRRIGLEFLGI